MIELAVYENGVSVGVIELTDSETFPLALTKSNSDIRDIKKRQGVYSKDFEILATAKNNRILKYIYNANVTAIGGRDCTVLNNGLPILDGLVFAVEAKQREQSETYKLRIFSDNVDWYIALGDTTIKDFDYGNNAKPSFNLLNGGMSGVVAARTSNSVLDEVYINASWLYPEDFDYVYPLISYGQPQTGVSVNEVDFRPAIYFGKMLTKAFASVGYTLESDFFSTGLGSRLILPYIGDNFKQDNDFIEDNSFEVAGVSTLATNVLTLQSNIILVNGTDITDSGARYNNTTGIFTIGNPANYVFSARGEIRITFNGQTDTVRLGLLSFRVGINGILSNEVTYNGIPANQQVIDVPVNTPVILEYSFTTLPIPLIAGATYSLSANINILNCIEYFTGIPRAFNVFWIGAGNAISFSMQAQPEITKGQTYNVASTLLPLKVIDLIGGLQNMFNLYFDTDNQNRTVRIEPKPSIIKPITQGIDFTDKLDIQNRITTDYIQEYNRELTFRFAKDTNDKWQEQYNLENGTVFGSALYLLGNEFREGITEVGTNVFAATVIHDKHPFSTTGCPIPVLWNENVPSPPKSFDFLPRVLYYKGLEQIFISGGGIANWRWIATYQTLIPTSFMLDPDSGEANPVNILYNETTLYPLGTTVNGLAKTYYNSDIAIIADRRIHKAYFNIKPTIFRSIDLFTPVYIDHPNLKGWYYINQIIDYTPNKEKTTLVELVRALDALPFTTPQAIEIPYVQENRRSNTSLGGGTLTAGKAESNESAVLMNGSGNAGIIRGGGVVMGNGNIQTETNQHLFGNYNFENDSVWVVGAGISPDLRYNGLQLKPNGVFNVHGGNVRTIRGGRILDVYATIDNRLENVLISGNG